MTSSLILYRPAIDAALIAVNRERARQRLYSLSPEQVRALMRGDPFLWNALSPEWAHASTEAAVNAVSALLNSGFLEIFSGTQPAVDAANTGTKLAKLGFAATAFGAASSASSTTTATAAAITSDTAAVAGTAGYHALMKTGDIVIVATGSVGTATSDLIVSSTTIAGGATVSCSAYTITQSQL